MDFVKFFVSVFGIALSHAAFAAAPAVSDVTMTQDADRTVTITYALSAPAVVTLDIVTNSAAGWVSIGGEHVRHVVGDVWKVVAADGQPHAMTWRPTASWPGHLVADGGVKALVTAWPLTDTPDYMVVDVNVGAAKRTVWFYPAVEFLPGGILGNSDYRINKIVLRRIRAGGVSWMMGSVFENGRNAATEAAHPARLDADYYIGVFELTQGQFQCIAGFNPSGFSDLSDSPMYPLNSVSYTKMRCAPCTNDKNNDYKGGGWPNAPYAGSFLDLLRQRTGIDFDLPSEAQWEYAGRSGTCEDQWNNGKRKEDDTMPGQWKRDPNDIHPVACGSFEQSRWGLYDMHGNIFELCNDWYLADITALGGAPNVCLADCTKMADGVTVGVNRVRRGGAYHAGTSSVSYRNVTADPKTAAPQWGFRLICPVGIAR